MGIVFGILMAFLSNFLLSDIGDNAWRWMLGVEAFPALIFTALVSSIPKSPRWLLMNGKESEAKKVLQKMTRDDAKRMRQQSAAAPARLSQREREQ